MPACPNVVWIVDGDRKALDEISSSSNFALNNLFQICFDSMSIVILYIIVFSMHPIDYASYINLRVAEKSSGRSVVFFKFGKFHFFDKNVFKTRQTTAEVSA